MHDARTIYVTGLGLENLGDNSSMMMRPPSSRFPPRSRSVFLLQIPRSVRPCQWNRAVEAYQPARRGFADAAGDPFSLRV